MKTDKEVMDLFEQSLDSELDRRLFRKYPRVVLGAYIKAVSEKKTKTPEMVRLCERLSQILEKLTKEE